MSVPSLAIHAIINIIIFIGFQSTRGCSLSCVYWLMQLCTA